METQLTLLAGAIGVVTVLLGTFWLTRVRASRRLRLAADAHAEREIALEAHWRAGKGAPLRAGPRAGKVGGRS
jgi:hypothetical protein